MTFKPDAGHIRGWGSVVTMALKAELITQSNAPMDNIDVERLRKVIDDYEEVRNQARALGLKMNGWKKL